MQRAITGYHLDLADDWVAELACGHDQHVRHRPPFQQRPWVTTPAGRAGRLGKPLDCPLCDRAELPATVRLARTSDYWDLRNMPAGLRHAHRLAAGRWGRIEVASGTLTFTAATAPPMEVVVGTGSSQAIPPQVEHKVEPSEDVRFRIAFFVVDRTMTTQTMDGAGDPACWAGLVCPACGGVTTDPAHGASCGGSGGASPT